MAHYPLNHHLRQTYRFLAGLAGLYLALVGVLGLAATWGDPFTDRGHEWVLGLRVNPASAWLYAIARHTALDDAELHEIESEPTHTGIAPDDSRNVLAQVHINVNNK